MGAQSSSEVQQDDLLNSELQSNYVEQMLPSLPLVGAVPPNVPIGLHSHHRQLTRVCCQLEALQHLSAAFPETVDLVLATADGATEPVHAFYLAMKAPKFWSQQIVPQIDRFKQQQQQKQQQQKSGQPVVHRLLTSEQLVHEVPRVLLKGISGQMLHIIVGSMYHRAGCLKLDYGLAWQLLPIGRDYELDFLLKKCFKCLAGQLSAGNAVQVMQVALRFGHQPLATAAYRYILLHFHDILVLKPECLVELTLGQLTAILADDHLNIANEMDAFLAAVFWVMYCPKSRLAHFWSPLFLQVRTQVIPSTMWPLMAHLFGILVRQQQNDAALMKRLLLKPKALSAILWPMPLFNPRVPRTVALIYGGFEGGLPSSTLKTFDIRAGRCFSLDLPGAPPRVHHATVALQGRGGQQQHRLLVVGGTDGLEVLNTVLSLNLATGRFSACPSMTERRSHLAAVVVTVGTGKGHHHHTGGQTTLVIAMGGCNNTSGSMRSCEAYDSRTKVWRQLPPMHTARKEAAAAVHANKVYITGGVDSFCNSSVEVLTMTSTSPSGTISYAWTVVSFMCVPRRGHALLSSGGCLYAVGGCTDVTEYTWSECICFWGCCI